MHRHGVTLIELVVVMLLAGVLAVSASLAVLPVTEGLLIVRRHVESAQKMQFVMNRLSRELSMATNVVSGDSVGIIYDVPAGLRRLQWVADDALYLNDIPLLDDVEGFRVNYYAATDQPALSDWDESVRLVEIVLQAPFSSGNVYTNRVYLKPFVH